MNSSANGADDGFDLPRWQTQQSYNLANSPAAAQYASTAMYGAIPHQQLGHAAEQTSNNRLPPLNMMGIHTSQQIPSAPARQQQAATDMLPPLSAQPSGALGRSLSLSGANSLLSSTRGRHQNQMEDLEGAYVERSEPAASQRQMPPPKHTQQQPSISTSYYPSSSTYTGGSNQQYSSLGATGNAHTMQQNHESYDNSTTYDSTRRSQSQQQLPQQQSPAANVSSTPRKFDAYGQPPSMYQSSAIYGSTSFGDQPQQSNHYQSPSKSTTPYLSPQQVQQPLLSPSQYSPSYTSAVDTQPQTPSSAESQSRARHQHSLSQTQIQQHQLSPQQQQHLYITSASSPSSPMTYQSQTRGYFTPPIKDEPMADMLPPPVQAQRPDSATRDYDSYGQSNSSRSMKMEVTTRQRRPQALRRVLNARDLRPIINPQPPGRRADPTRGGAFLSPLLCLTTNLASTYTLCNPAFRYESSHNPRRVLTKPSKPTHNDGFDNEDFDYILYVNDWLGSEDGNKYLILDVLGQGTFGQVVKCQNMKTHDVVAVKVVKNKPAYFNQSMMEVTILDMLNNQHDAKDEHHILRMLDSFVHKNHLCLVFELLSQNLYELIKQNQFQGLSTQLVKVFTAQLLDALCVLKDARLIHCDLKPENILLKSLSSPGIKVIDFGSACHERQTVYTYIQSRFYRSPEVLLGLSYNSAIDMWSLGCIAVELFLGLPLFPGTSEYNQITRIVEMLGLPPDHMLENGKQTGQFFDGFPDQYGQKKYKLKSLEQYSREHNTNEQPGKQYFKASTLPEIINIAPMPVSKHSTSSRPSSAEVERETLNRAAFIDFCMGLLNLNPMQRWTPQQARRHPFITGEKWVKSWQPYATITEIPAPAPALTPASSTDPRRPYGGLVQSQPKGTRAYQDAAAYNQQLNQHQTYTAQQQAAQATSQAYRNPYIAAQNNQQQQPPVMQVYPARTESEEYGNQQPQQQRTSQPSQQQQQRQQQQGNAYTLQSSQSQPSQQSSMHTSTSTGVPMSVSHSYNSQGPSQPINIAGNPNPPSSSYYPNARARANTINQMDAVPPALARLTQMNKDLSGVGRNTLTPIINRDDAMREWERRQAGKAQPAHSYPQLEYLQQQAEMAGGVWQGGGGAVASRYPPPQTMQYQSPVQLLMDNQDRRRNRTEQRQEYGSMPAPPQNSYGGGDGNLGNVYVPMQPNQYGSATATAQSQPSLYSSAIATQGQQPAGVYTQKPPYSTSQQQVQRDNRRHSGMGLENWTR